MENTCEWQLSKLDANAPDYKTFGDVLRPTNVMLLRYFK